jgi:hypothetical protein
VLTGHMIYYAPKKINLFKGRCKFLDTGRTLLGGGNDRWVLLWCGVLKSTWGYVRRWQLTLDSRIQPCCIYRIYINIIYGPQLWMQLMDN